MPKIEQQCSMMAGCCRFVWNKALAMNFYRLENKHPILWYNEMTFWLTLWKKSGEYSFLGKYSFLKDPHSQALQQTLKNLDRAFKGAFDKSQTNKRLPVFKRKGQHDSFRYPQGFKIEGNRAFLPKIDWVRFFNSRKIEGIPRNVTVTRQADGWYISVQVEMEVETAIHPTSNIVGVDRGIAELATLSNGERFAPSNSYRRYQDKLAKAQRQLTKKTTFSENWKKQQRKIAKIHHKIAQVSNMSKSAKGTIEEPGKNVKAKAGLNKSILHQGWSMFATMLEYKQAWRGGEALYVKQRLLIRSRRFPLRGAAYLMYTGSGRVGGS